MYALMIEIGGTLTRCGRGTKQEGRAIDRAIKLFYDGYRDQRVTYVEVWERGTGKTRMSWSTQMAGLK